MIRGKALIHCCSLFVIALLLGNWWTPTTYIHAPQELTHDTNSDQLIIKIIDWKNIFNQDTMIMANIHFTFLFFHHTVSSYSLRCYKNSSLGYKEN